MIFAKKSLIAAIFVAQMIAVASVQAQARDAQTREQQNVVPQQLEDKDPNRIALSLFRLRGSVTKSQSEYKIPVRLWPEDCTRCELISNITENTEVIAGDGTPKPVYRLKPNHTYKAIAVQYSPTSVKEIERIQLVPKR